MALHSITSVEDARDDPLGLPRLHRRTWWIVVVALALLAVTALATATPSTTSGASTFRTVDGNHRRVQVGYATYLARSFHGDETANGEIFDERKLIAAHRSLPFNSRVRVRNLENGRFVDVRIIDRGPYGKNWREGTIIDVSRAAARRLGMIEDGQVRVRVTVLSLGPDRATS
jgi:peptidoglycan lytic transglycosylase